MRRVSLISPERTPPPPSACFPFELIVRENWGFTPPPPPYSYSRSFIFFPSLRSFFLFCFLFFSRISAYRRGSGKKAFEKAPMRNLIFKYGAWHLWQVRLSHPDGVNVDERLEKMCFGVSPYSVSENKSNFSILLTRYP